MALPMRLKNSLRVRASARKHPVTAEVTVVAPGLETPRMHMHMWLASRTTATPCGFKISSSAVAICFVSRSCTCRSGGSAVVFCYDRKRARPRTWRRRPYMSLMRASLESPMTRRSGT
jgi:hypothetical protein